MREFMLGLPGDRKAYAVDAKRLSHGGYADVFGARVKASQDRVAFKRLRSPMQIDQKRFRREIRIQRELDGHPHVMPILDAGHDFGWYVMPLALGDAEKLHSELNGMKALKRLIEHAVSGLAAAHETGHVHRDVTPRNILALDEGRSQRWVVADWGLVRQPRGMTTSKLTTARRPIGTAGFVAPELWRDPHHAASPTSDVYSLGRVVAWAVSGKWPLAGERLLPGGPFYDFIRRATAPRPEARPSLGTLVDLLHEIGATAEADPLDEAAGLARDASDGDEDAATRLIAVALEHQDDEDLILDSLPAVGGKPLRVLVREDPDAVRELVTAMGRHLLSGWQGRAYAEANRSLSWLQHVASHAIAVGEYGLVEDAAEALFEGEAEHQQYDQRHRTRAWLQKLDGDGAAAVARALQRVPRAAYWYAEEDWRPGRTTHPAIRSVVASA